MDTDTNPPVEETPEPAAVEQPEPDTEPAEEPKDASEEREQTFQKLIQMMEQDAELQKDESLNGDEVFKGIKYKETLMGLDDDAKKLLSNMRSDYTRKSQDLSEQRKQLEAQANELEAQRKAMLESGYLEKLAEKANQDVEINPWDEKSIEGRIEQEVAKRLEELMRPMQTEYAVQQREIQLRQFKAEHPDLENYKHEIVDTLKENEGMRLEQAYWLVKGQKLDAEMKTQARELSQYKSAAREAGLKVGGLSRRRSTGIPDNVKTGSAYDIYKFLANQKQKK